MKEKLKKILLAIPLTGMTVFFIMFVVSSAYMFWFIIFGGLTLYFSEDKHLLELIGRGFLIMCVLYTFFIQIEQTSLPIQSILVLRAGGYLLIIWAYKPLKDWFVETMNWRKNNEV